MFRTRPVPTRRPSYRPLCEALEGRLAPANFIVTNTNDGGPGSLRQAILDANANSGADAIQFNIPGGGVQTIAPQSPLPDITDTVGINGYTQPGSSPNTLAVGSNAVLRIELNGSGLVLSSSASNSAILGLVINRSPSDRIPSDGIFVLANGARIEGNFIGTNAAGDTASPNAGSGITIAETVGVQIGGTAPAARNVISGNGEHGVFAYRGVLIQGNIIGLNAAGTLALPNSEYGLRTSGILNGNNIIGGTAPGAGNVISGNHRSGISLDRSSTLGSGNAIRGNIIGLNAAGNAAVGNGSHGIEITGYSSNNQIGDTTAAGRNVISGNTFEGVYLAGPGVTGNSVTGNYIGTDATGTLARGNGMGGVNISAGASDNTVGGPQLPGDDGPVRGNVISGNARDGVVIAGDDTSGNKVYRNYIGLKAGGAAALGNGRHGVRLFLAPNNEVGHETTIQVGVTATYGNVISANQGHGIHIEGSTATGNTVRGNTIGLPATGGLYLGNQGPGASVLGAKST